MPGLVSRRMREAALFLKPVEKPEEPFMPQTVSASAEPAKPATVATAAGAAAVVATQAIPGLPIPGVPPEIADSITNVSAWKTVAEHAGAIKTWAVAQPTMALGLSITVAAFYLYSKRGQSQ